MKIKRRVGIVHLSLTPSWVRFRPTDESVTLFHHRRSQWFQWQVEWLRKAYFSKSNVTTRWRMMPTDDPDAIATLQHRGMDSAANYRVSGVKIKQPSKEKGSGSRQLTNAQIQCIERERLRRIKVSQKPVGKLFLILFLIPYLYK